MIKEIDIRISINNEKVILAMSDGKIVHTKNWIWEEMSTDEKTTFIQLDDYISGYLKEVINNGTSSK